MIVDLIAEREHEKEQMKTLITLFERKESIMRDTLEDIKLECLQRKQEGESYVAISWLTKKVHDALRLL